MITIEDVQAAKDDELAELARSLELSTRGKPATVRKRLIAWLEAEAQTAGNAPDTDERARSSSSAPSSGTDVPGSGAELGQVLDAVRELGATIADVRRGLGDVAGDLAGMRSRVERLEQRPPLAVHEGGAGQRRAPHQQQQPPAHGRVADEHRPQGVPVGAPTGAHSTGAGTTYRLPDGVEPPRGAVSPLAARVPDAAVTSTHGGVTHRVADELAGDPAARRQVAPPPGAAVARGAPRLADGAHDLRGGRLEQLAGQLLTLTAELRGELDKMHPDDPRKPGALQRWHALSSTAQNLAGHLADD